MINCSLAEFCRFSNGATSCLAWEAINRPYTTAVCIAIACVKGPTFTYCHRAEITKYLYTTSPIYQWALNRHVFYPQCCSRLQYVTQPRLSQFTTRFIQSPTRNLDVSLIQLCYQGLTNVFPRGRSVQEILILSGQSITPWTNISLLLGDKWWNIYKEKYLHFPFLWLFILPTEDWVYKHFEFFINKLNFIIK